MRRSLSFDLLVLGAGPAGAAAARTAAGAGLSVALVDKAAFPRDKLCGGLVTGRAMGAMAQVFGDGLTPEPWDLRGRFAFRMAGADLGTLTGPPVALTMRRDFDAALLAQALAAGATDFTGRRVGGIDGTTVRLEGGEVLTGRVLIGADGVNSAVARALFGAAFEKARIGFALEVEAPVSDETALAVEIDFGAAAGGYGWRFPKSGSTTIGIGGPLAQNPDMKAGLAAYLSGFGLGAEEMPVKGHFIPFGDFRRRPGRGAVLLAGDAAGLVDPVTGEGIAHALASGHFAALSAAEALERGRPRAALGLYRRRLRSIHRGLRIARMLRPLIWSRFGEKRFPQAFRRSETVKAAYLAVLAGQADYPDLLRTLGGRVPRLVAMAVR